MKFKERIDDWREAEFLTVQAAAKIAGLSPASLYKAEAVGRIEFRRLLGRTIIPTASLIQFLDGTEEWHPSNRGAAGRAKRAERAQAAWEG